MYLKIGTIGNIFTRKIQKGKNNERVRKNNCIYASRMAKADTIWLETSNVFGSDGYCNSNNIQKM